MREEKRFGNSTGLTLETPYNCNIALRPGPAGRADKIPCGSYKITVQPVVRSRLFFIPMRLRCGEKGFICCTGK